MQGVILNRYRQGETSIILKIFSDEFGFLGVYVRGGMKKKEVPEIGDLIEGEPKRRGHEGLYSLYQFTVLEKFSFPTFLELNTLRDIAFETLWRTLPEEDSHVELFRTLLLFLNYLRDKQRTISYSYFALWLFLYRYTEQLGITLTFTHCSLCGKEAPSYGIDPVSGEVVCGECRPRAPLFPPMVGGLLLGSIPVAQIASLSPRERLQVTSLFISYVKHHLGYKGDFHTMQFLKELLL